MAQQDIPRVKLAAMYTARLITGANASASRALHDLFGWGVNTTRGRLSGLDEGQMRQAFLDLVDTELNEGRATAQTPAAPTIDEHIKIAELRRDLRETKALREELALELGAARDLRENVLGLIGEPLMPRKIVAPKGGKRAMTWMINLSDNHLGKKFARDEVSGLQDYNVEIARNRIRRTFAKAVELIKLNGAPVDRLVVNLMGDNANGALRHDDDRSNEIAPFAQARVVAECVRDGIDLLRDEFPKVAIEVNVLPGNHGRTTANPPSVEIAENYDCLAGALLEWHYAKEDGVHISNTGQADVLLDIYGRGYLLTHGDRIGAGGGDGQIGPLGPTKRGSLRIGAQELEIGKYIADRPDLAAVIMGHFHYQWTDMDVFVSGAAMGPDPWSFRSNKMRAKPKPPTQWLLGIEAEKGIIEAKWLFVGHPDEGPICSFRSREASLQS